MKDIYKNWIDNFITNNNGKVRGLCHSASENMITNFTELRLVRGFVVDGFGFKHQHWWCEDTDKNVVDATAIQFDIYGGVERYEEYNIETHGPEPTGKCLYCGEYCYNGRVNTCSDECDEDLIKSL